MIDALDAGGKAPQPAPEKLPVHTYEVYLKGGASFSFECTALKITYQAIDITSMEWSSADPQHNRLFHINCDEIAAIVHRKTV